MGRFAGTWLDQLELSSERLVLRPWRDSDTADVERIMADPAMSRFLATPDPYTRADALAYVTGPARRGRRDGSAVGAALVRREDGRLVGAASLRLCDGPHTVGAGAADIGYWVAAEARGRGYAAEATRALARWGFGVGIDRVEIRCAVQNLASAATALRAGFRYEGTLRAGWTPPGAAPADDALFARLADDEGDPIPPYFPALPCGGLGDGTLALRVGVPDDAAAMLVEAQDADVRRWAFSDTPPSTAQLTQRAASAGLRWLIGPDAALTMIDLASGEPAGFLQLRLSGPPGVGLLGYSVLPAFRGRGYTSRALRLIADWAFGPGGFARLELGAKVTNSASRRAAAAAGFAEDGIRYARLPNHDGSRADEARYALLAPELR